MSEHSGLLRLVVSQSESGFRPTVEQHKRLLSAADHLERCESALRDSTELLRYACTPVALNRRIERLKDQIAANEAALKDGK